MSVRAVDSSRVINATPFFYGWVILISGTLGTVMMGASQTFTFGLFIDPIVQELQISRANLSLLYGLATLGASALLPLVGRLIDRYGARRVMLLAVCGFGLACLGMSGVQGLSTVLFGLLALRFMGFGAMNLTSSTLIAQWFVRRRGFVMGLAGQSLAISLLIYPPLGEFLIARLGWRQAWLAFGLLAVLVMVPVSWFFYRNRPEQYGLHPDGDVPPPAPAPATSAPTSRSAPSDEDWTLAEARRTAAFWVFAIALATMAMVTAGLVFHQTSLFETQGLGREAAVRVFQFMALFSIGGNLLMGQLLDRYSARYVLAGLLALISLMLITVQVMSTPLHGLGYGLLMGLCSGSFRVLDAVIWAKYYGRRHLGSIRGVTMFGAIGGTALGAYPLGFSFDHLGSYRPALNALLAIALTMMVIALFVKRPTKDPNS